MDKALEKQLRAFAETVSLNRGRAYYVGGFVRDGLLGVESKDIDIEVHGIDAAALRRIVESHFKEVNEEGKAFGVLRVTALPPLTPPSKGGEYQIDISLPRTDSKVAPGHRGFEVKTDPFMGIEAASQRRDFTINAMLQDVLSGEVHDPHGGRVDLEAKVLRAVDLDLFGDDPLRVLRAVQLVARFDLAVESETMTLMKKMVPTLGELSSDRKREEWKKLFLKARTPSRGLTLAFDLGLFHSSPLSIFETMAATEQDPIWHPEGSVWKHTLWGCDEAAKISDREKLNHDDRLVVMLGELLHDAGKPVSTRHEGGRVHSKGHADTGVIHVGPCLKAMGLERFTDAVEKMVRYHHHPMKWAVKGGTDDRFLIKLARDLKPVTVRLLCYVTEADLRSRGPYTLQMGRAELRTPEIASAFLKRAVELGVADHAPANVINGNELIKFGFTPGPLFGLIVRAANALHDENGLDKKAILEKIAAAPELAEVTMVDEMLKKLRH